MTARDRPAGTVAGMTPAPHRMWQALAATDGPLPATVLDAAISHALATEPLGSRLSAADQLRGALIARPDVPLATAARLADWPADHPLLATAYLRRADHPAGALPALLEGLSEATLLAAVAGATSPELLTLLGQAASRQVVRAVIRNRNTPQPARLNALTHLIEKFNVPADQVLDGLDTHTAAALAGRTDDLAALAVLITSYPLGTDAHARVAVLAARAAVLDGGNLTAGDPAAAALEALAGVADRALMDRLVADLTGAGVRVEGRAIEEVLLSVAPVTFPAHHTPLADRNWAELLAQLTDDRDAAATFAVVLDEHLGTSPDAWHAFTALAGTHTGTLAELLTAATGIGAPAA